MSAERPGGNDRQVRLLKAANGLAGGHAGQRTPDEISEIVEIAGREGETIRQLRTWFTELLEVQAAEESLTALTPAEVSAALERRRLRLEQSS